MEALEFSVLIYKGSIKIGSIINVGVRQRA